MCFQYRSADVSASASPDVRRRVAADYSSLMRRKKGDGIAVSLAVGLIEFSGVNGLLRTDR